MKHDLYKNGDKNIPPQILDRNGEVVLALCKVCGQAEGDLEESCNPPTEAWKMYDLARAKMAAELLIERDKNEKLKAERDELEQDRQYQIGLKTKFMQELNAAEERCYELAAQVDILKNALKASDSWYRSFASLHHKEVNKLISEALALPDLSTGTLNRVRAEAAERCANICDAQHDRARTSPGAARALACATDIRKLIADMEAGKC